jgi:hypothetical protein
MLSRFFFSGAIFIVLGPWAGAALAQQWYFWVQNNTNTGIKEIQVSQNKKTWGYFDIGKGVVPGQKLKIVWDESTNNEACEQWIKTTFYDGSESEPSKIDFCKDLDTPVVFE